MEFEVPTNKESSLYLSDDYVQQNPTWDEEDSPWKAKQVSEFIIANDTKPKRVVEVGCGAGGILAELRLLLGEDVELDGFDIAPAAAQFWSKHSSTRVNFYSEDFLKCNNPTYDLLLLIDVIEHLENPFEFMRRISHRSEYFVFHIPLDMNVLNVLQERPLLNARKKVGHIHYYTKQLALELLNECGFEIIDWTYTGSRVDLPHLPFKAKLAAIPRKLLFKISPDFSVRTLGGYSLLVLAKRKID